MFSHRLAAVCGCQPIRSAVSRALRGAGSPACRQVRYASNRAARTSRSVPVSGYSVNAVQRHVNAADVLVRRGVDKDGSRAFRPAGIPR